MALLLNSIWLVLLVYLRLAFAQNTAQSPPIPALSDEPFFQPPADLDKIPLGTIIRSRPVPNPIQLAPGIPLLLEAAWQILYRTQNSLGVPEANIVTLLVPYKAKKNNLFVLSYFTVRFEGVVF
jgi:hypothetical protein